MAKLVLAAWAVRTLAQGDKLTRSTLQSAFFVLQAEYFYIIRALSKGKIADGHVTLLMTLAMACEPTYRDKGDREDIDFRISVPLLSKSLNCAPPTVVKRIQHLADNRIIEIDPSTIRSSSRFLVKQGIRYDLLPKIKVITEKRSRFKTNNVESAIKEIKTYIPPEMRNFSNHPKHYRGVASILDLKLDLRDYVRWLVRTNGYFSLGLFYNSFVLKNYRKLKNERVLSKDNEQDADDFWRDR